MEAIDPNKLYARYEKKVYKIAESYEASETDDLAQECWVEILDALPTYDFKASIGTFIHSVAENTCRQWVRAQMADKRQAILYEHELAGPSGDYNDDGDLEYIDSGEEASDAEDPFNMYAADELVMWIEDNLSEQQLTCLTLAGEGLSLEEISEETGLAVSTVHTHISRAREKAAAYIGE